jgi:hypothetical protein
MSTDFDCVQIQFDLARRMAHDCAMEIWQEEHASPQAGNVSISSIQENGVSCLVYRAFDLVVAVSLNTTAVALIRSRLPRQFWR